MHSIWSWLQVWENFGTFQLVHTHLCQHMEQGQRWAMPGKATVPIGICVDQIWGQARLGQALVSFEIHVGI